MNPEPAQAQKTGIRVIHEESTRHQDSAASI